MIAVRLLGGLGNQMFQFAAARALAVKHRCEIILDDSKLAAAGATARQLELGHFRAAARLASPSEQAKLRVAARVGMLSRWLTGWRTYREQTLGHNPRFASLDDDTFLIGYWQTDRYFRDIADLLRQDFLPATPLSGRNLELAAKARSTGAVAVHVRRGDYVTLKSAASFHGALSLKYYEDSIARFRASLTSPHFFIFSDDAEWTRANLPVRADEATFVTHNQGQNAWEDMLLMASCSHHVIANSSFSWWGAWLHDPRDSASGQMVVAPKRWFAADESPQTDRFPTHWQLIRL